MKRFLPFLMVVMLLLLATATSAQVVVPPPCSLDAPCRGGVFTDPDWLKLDYQRVNVDIDNQIATTQVEMQFTNIGDALAEGTFIFPLPQGATVSDLTMWVDGQRIESKILEAGEARGIYDEIVRQYRDPALLEYINSSTIQANVFPIAPGDSRRIEITYAQVLEVDNGLIHYVYPMHKAINGQRIIDEMSISVNVTGNDPISTIYSPSHNIAINRAQDTANVFRAGFETNNFQPDADFSLYYGIANENINVNLLTYRESATEDGFFMMLVQPPILLPDDQIIAKDVIVVLDQSGSMSGEKWEQGQEAAAYVLGQLNPQDRFNVILFSTGWRIYAREMMRPDTRGTGADDAIDWINREQAEGGTDINGALLTALDMVGERPTTVLFLTDGLATEGETTITSEILENLKNASKPNVRIFTFGVGNDVDTVLLDSIVRDHRGAGSYVRPSENIEEEVASLYNKISSPVMTDLEIDMGDARVDWMYPAQLPDLFAGEQLTLVGRYRDAVPNNIITLTGQVGGETMTLTFEGLDFRERAGGEPFISQLWATRRIGDLLNSIRLQGENDELVQSVVDLSLRYGVITPYTSFLIEEDDILSQQGRARANDEFMEEAETLAGEFTGAGAVEAADASANMAAAQAPMRAMPTTQAGGLGGPASAPTDGDTELYAPEPSVNPIQTVNGKTFILQGTVWMDTTYEPDTMETEKIEFLSDAYFDLLLEKPEIASFLALGDEVVVLLDGTAYEITVPATE